MLFVSKMQYLLSMLRSVFFAKNVAVKSFISFIASFFEFAQFIVKSKLVLSRLVVFAKYLVSVPFEMIKICKYLKREFDELKLSLE